MLPLWGNRLPPMRPTQRKAGCRNWDRDAWGHNRVIDPAMPEAAYLLNLSATRANISLLGLSQFGFKSYEWHPKDSQLIQFISCKSHKNEWKSNYNKSKPSKKEIFKRLNHKLQKSKKNKIVTPKTFFARKMKMRIQETLKCSSFKFHFPLSENPSTTSSKWPYDLRWNDSRHWHFSTSMKMPRILNTHLMYSSRSSG